MKKRIILTSFVTFLLFLTSFSPAFAAFRSEPVSLFPLHQRDKFDTDLFSGSATYSYPIKVPKGTNDLAPEVSLSYNSAGVRDFMQRTGLGWQMNQDYVERDVNFTPSDTGDDKFKLHFKGGVYDLVYVSSENRYHTKTESFLNIQKLTGGQNTKGEYWQVITSDGTKYRFGYGDNSEFVANARPYVTYWSLDLATDVRGNNIYYTYIGGDGTDYLSQIKYNNDQSRIIDFTYTTSPYQRRLYIQGGSTLEYNRLSNIQVKIGTNLVRQYDLAYGTAANGQSLLQSITEKGSDGSVLPPTTFDYKPVIKTWQAPFTKWLDNADVDAHLLMQNVGLSDVNADGLIDIVKTDHGGGTIVTWKVLLNNGTSWATNWEIWVNNAPIEEARLDRSDVRLVDVTGDNLPDIVKSAWDAWRVWRNTGTSWSTTEERWVEMSNMSADTTLDKTNIGLSDVNGDGLPDIVRSYNHDDWYVHLNTGSSWSSQAQLWAHGLQAKLGDTDTTMADVNGDGLTDVIRSISTDTWNVWINTGSSWNITPEKWLDHADVDASLIRNNITMADANGDGLIDIIRVTDLGPGDLWQVLLNKGNKWATTWETWIDPSQSVDNNSLDANVRMADITGDGITDIVMSFADGGRDTWKVWRNSGNAPDLLAKITTTQGGTVNFDYASSTQVDNTGPDSLSDLAYPMWLVTKMTVANDMTTLQMTTDVTQYNYSNGLYDYFDREFRGFGTVDETSPNTAKKKYVFNQDDALKGLLSEVQTRDAQSNPFAETKNSWSSSQSNGVYTVSLTQEKNYTYDGLAAGPKITQTDYQYDSYGNVTKKSELGDTSAIGDERFNYFEYAINPSLWIINSLKHTYLNGSDDSTKASENWFYYDSNIGLDDVPTKGDVTRDVKWSNVTGLSNPTTLYEYDSFGNQTKITNANNRATQQAYDTSATYPISTTNAKNQTSTSSYDLGTGNLLSKTDPNGFITSYTYDVFGRISKEIKPYDSSSFPTVNYQYFNDGLAPEGTLISKREVSGAPGTIDTYMWVDGLGRKVQTRTEAEDPLLQIVTDTFYDTTGEILKETASHLDTVSTGYVLPISGVRNTSFSYDPLARINIVTNPKGGVRTISYDHWKETTIDENGHIKRQYVNAYNKINKVEEVNGVNTYATNYEYDSRDNLTKIIDASNNISTFTYDSLGRKKSQTDSDMGTWQYEYDGIGNLIKQIDNRNISVLKTYDELDRITKTDYPTDVDTTYTYDGNGKIGTLTSLIDTAGTLNFSYDNRLRKTQETRVIDGNTWTTQYAYDSMDRMISRTNPDAEVISYAFNAQGEVNSAGGILSNIDYDALGKITKKDFANGISTNYTYNTDDFRLNKIQTNTLQDMNYSYDSVGNVLGITNNLLIKTQNFGYDDLDRLKTASETGGYNYSYEYNAIGNITKFTNAGVDIDYTYGQSAGVHALTLSTETVSTPTPTPTPTPTATPTPPAGQSVSSFTLINADIDQPIAGFDPIPVNATINLSSLPTKNLNIRANTNPQIVGSVRFGFDSNSNFGTENNPPYALASDNGGDYFPWTPSAGSHTLTATPYTSQNAAGTAGTPLSLAFTVTDSGTPTPTPTSTPIPTATPTPTPTPSSGYSGQYFDNKTLTGTPKLTRTDAAINFNWGTGSPSSLIPVDNFSVRWTKTETFVAGTYKFSMTGDDGVRLYIDNVLVIDKWIDQPATTYTITKTLSAGSHTIKMEYYESGGGAVAKLSYKQIVPYSGQYFDNKTLTGTPKLTRNDTTINFNWGSGSPNALIPPDNFSARWTKTETFVAGTYKFSMTGDDGVRLYIDNVLVIDKWIDQPATTYTITKTLSAGSHTIKMEYYESGGGAVAKLSY